MPVSFARRAVFLVLIAAGAAGTVRADDSLQVPREPFANAHVTLMARVEVAGAGSRLAEVDVWAEGTRLRAKVRDDDRAGEFWLSGLGAAPQRVYQGHVAAPRPRTLEQGLLASFEPSTQLADSKTDRVAGHPCKLVTQKLGAGTRITRCIWRGLPLSVEMSGKGFSFNAAATLVEEGGVTVADLQPPPGASAAPASMTAGN